jgi:hypothetical protein
MSFRERRWWHQIISHIFLTADVPPCQPQRDARVAAEFAETSPSISPDGRWLAYASHGDLVLVENWMEEVKAQGRN